MATTSVKSGKKEKKKPEDIFYIVDARTGGEHSVMIVPKKFFAANEKTFKWIKATTSTQYGTGVYKFEANDARLSQVMDVHKVLERDLSKFTRRAVF